MDYLTICKRVNDIAGFQGKFATVTTTGFQATIATAVKDAYEDIQRYRPDWEFMKTFRTVNVSDAATQYSLEDLWAGDTVDLASYQYINYDYKRLKQIHYETYMLQDFSTGSYTKPTFWAFEPGSLDLLIAPVDGIYTLELHYIRTLDKLSLNTQVPILPARFHQVIIYGALMKVSTFIGNQTLFDTYSIQYAEGMGQLLREQNPAKKVFKRPIA